MPKIVSLHKQKSNNNVSNDVECSPLDYSLGDNVLSPVSMVVSVTLQMSESLCRRCMKSDLDVSVYYDENEEVEKSVDLSDKFGLEEREESELENVCSSSDLSDDFVICLELIQVLSDESLPHEIPHNTIEKIDGKEVESLTLQSVPEQSKKNEEILQNECNLMSSIGDVNNFPTCIENIDIDITTPSIMTTIKSDENQTSFPLPSALEPELLQKVRGCIKNPDAVSLCKDGVGGTYFINDQTGDYKTIAVFKPSDEEPGSPNNPKKPLSKPLLPPGQGAIREVAAYLLDKGLAGVPETYLLENISHSAFATDGLKTGSVQKFVENSGDSGSMSSSRFSVSDVHSIGILDLRLFNMDRNEENILVQKIETVEIPTTPAVHRSQSEPTVVSPKEEDSWFFQTPSSPSSPNSSFFTPCSVSSPYSPFTPFSSSPSDNNTPLNRSTRAISSYTRPSVIQSPLKTSQTRMNRAISSPSPVPLPTYKLVPIDHTYSLPPTLDGAFFEWQYWKQSKEPFSEEHLNYIKNIDPEKDAMLLRKIGIDEAGIRTMMISSWFLKLGAESGMTLSQIAQLVTRRLLKEESFLEKIVRTVEESLNQKEKSFTIEQFIEKFVDQARIDLQNHLANKK